MDFKLRFNINFMIKGFIFDLDGVITDTAENHFQAWKHLSDKLNINFDRKINEKLRGVSRLESLKIIFNDNNISIETYEIDRLLKEKNDYYVKSLKKITPNDFLKGSKELLINLKNKGFKIALGSASKNSKLVLNRLNALNFFDVIADGNSVSKSKPDPEVFHYACNKLSLSPKECIVIEDAKSGIDAGIKGKFKTIGIGPKDRVGHADVFFSSMSSLNFDIIQSSFYPLL